MNNIQKNFKKKSQLRRASPGVVKGPGGPVDDMVGPVMLSSDEYVLPADTTAAVGTDNLDALVDATHVPAELQRELEMDVDMGKKNMRIALRGLADGTRDATMGASDDSYVLMEAQRQLRDTDSIDLSNPKILDLYERGLVDQPARGSELFGTADQMEQYNALKRRGVVGGMADGRSPGSDSGFFSSLRNIFGSSDEQIQPQEPVRTTPYLGTGLLNRAVQGLQNRNSQIQQQLDMINKEYRGMADGGSPLRMVYAADGFPPRMGPNMPIEDEIARNAAKDVAARRAADAAAEQARRSATSAANRAATGGTAATAAGGPSTLRKVLGVGGKVLAPAALALEPTDTATDEQMDQLARQYAEKNGTFFGGKRPEQIESVTRVPAVSPQPRVEGPSVGRQPGAAAVPGTFSTYSASQVLRNMPVSEPRTEDLYASRTQDINALFDARMREIASSPLRTKRDVYKMQELSELEQARAEALRQEADRMATLRGQDVDVAKARLAAVGKGDETAAQRRTATRGVLKDVLGDEGYAWWERSKRETFDPSTVERINSLSPEDQSTFALNMEGLASGNFEQVGGGVGPASTVGGVLGFLSGGKGKLGSAGAALDKVLARAPGPLKTIGKMGAFEKIFGKLGSTVLGAFGGGYVAGEADNRALGNSVALPMIDPQSGDLVTRDVSYRELVSMTFPQLYNYLTGADYAIAGNRAGELAPYQVPSDTQQRERLRQLGADIQYMGPRM
jgi:hypothetical protein